MELVTIDSCHHYWVFDIRKRRYRRVPKGPGLELRMANAEWRPYHDLRLDPYRDSFAVVLDQAGTRVLRSWRHLEATCPQCDAPFTRRTGDLDAAAAEVG
jgi:hypothetical protein